MCLFFSHCELTIAVLVTVVKPFVRLGIIDEICREYYGGGMRLRYHFMIVVSVKHITARGAG